LGISDFGPGDGGTIVRDGGHDGTVGGDDGSSGDDGPPQLTCADEDGGAGVSGCACDPTMTPAGCNGYAQTERLVCSNNTWTKLSNCAPGSNCDTRTGANQGGCVPLDPNCADAAPNQQICVGSNVVKCGPDLVSEMAGTTCSNACFDGGCTGTCIPGATQCTGNGVETCSAIGQWSAATSCSEMCSDGGCATFPSCTGGGAGTDSTCGPGADGGSGSVDCCSSFEVAGNAGGAAFYRSYDGISPGDTSETYAASLSNFRLDAFEVTVGRFRKFVAAVNGGWSPPSGSGIHTHLNGGSGLRSVGADASGFELGWSTTWNSNLSNSGSWDSNLACFPDATWTSTPSGTEQLPINCVNWYEAYAFCIWDGGFLPSEAEWNYAAAGGTEHREYAWSNSAGPADASPPDIDCTFANYAPSSGSPCVAAGPTLVGTYSPMGDGKWSQSDLTGNVSEWTLDTFAAYVTPCNDCANVTPITNHAVRGGAFNIVASAVISAYRVNEAASNRDGAIGVRCARVP
jgi:formylglycine-generating enzyme required for sulfatase activity